MVQCKVYIHGQRPRTFTVVQGDDNLRALKSQSPNNTQKRNSFNHNLFLFFYVFDDIGIFLKRN